jgi:tetratricopeptide (TPR) repeat protein
LLTSSLRFTEAEKDMNQALKVADKKDDVHYQYAGLIYQHYLLQANTPYEPWTLERGLQESKDAYKINAMPVYLQQQAQLLYAMQKYEEAFQLYQQLAQSDMRSADTFYAAAQCRLALKDQDGAIAQLDSAVNTFTKPYLRAAAPYLMARGRLLDAAGKYRLAVNDFNEYEKLMPGQLTAEFYYLREQSEYAGHLYQQAIDDIRKAADMAPQESLYQSEKASVELRVGMTDEAIASAREAIRLAPDQADLLLGLGLCVKGQKKEGLESLQKAKELGHEQAQSLIERYSK